MSPRNELDFRTEIQHERPCLTIFLNTERRAKNTTRSGVLLTNYEVFGNVVKQSLECL